jgi:hypothetical protein
MNRLFPTELSRAAGERGERGRGSVSGSMLPDGLELLEGSPRETGAGETPQSLERCVSEHPGP